MQYNTCTIAKIRIDQYITKNAKIFITKAKNSANIVMINGFNSSRKYVGKLFGFKEKSTLDKTLIYSGIIAMCSILTYAAIKVVEKLNTIKEQNKIHENEKINQIIENLDQDINKKSTKTKWALWPNEIPFLTLVRIPKDLLLEKLLLDIQKTYKADKNSSDIVEKNYAIESFINDIEKEISDYQKKYNIILIGNFEKKYECIEKIQDNIKKLIYLKNCISGLKDNF